ncbi:MAG TPA: hypothetical protein VFE59_03515, partial [Trebonia sp.]|nr:hypothetical protein [Trebonia sp.]
RSRGDAGRYKFISRRGSYHGATHGALSLGGGGGNNGAEYGPLPYGGVRRGDHRLRPHRPDVRD